MAMGLRLAQDADAERLLKLINAAFGQAESHIVGRERVDPESVRSLLAKGEFLLAEDEAALAGCVYLERRGERAYLGLLAVAPERQNQGVGSMLMREAEQRSARAGCRFMDLRIINLRRENHAFYTRRGYVETGTEPFPPGLETRLPCHFINMCKPLG